MINSQNSDRIGACEAWYPSKQELINTNESRMRINYEQEIEFFRHNSDQYQPHPLRALRVHQMARFAKEINDRGKVLLSLALKNPSLSPIFAQTQVWLYQTPIIRVSKIALENTLIAPVIIRNVTTSANILSVVANAKKAWNEATSDDLIVFKRLEARENNIYVGLRPEASIQLTPYFYFHARNHRFIGRFLLSVGAPAKNLTYPDAVLDASPPYNLKSRHPPLATVILDCTDHRSMNREWDFSLVIKIMFTDDKLSIFSFNENQNHAEGSLLHPYSPNTHYNDNRTINPVQGHQYHLDFIHDEANKISIYDFMSGARKFSIWEIQIFMNDKQVSSFGDAVNFPLLCKNMGVLNDPMSSEYIEIENCSDCNMKQFKTESCEDLPSMSGHYFFYTYQQFISRNQLYGGFKFNSYPLKVSYVFIKCAKQMNGSRLIPFHVFWQVFRNEFPSLKLSKNWFSPWNKSHGFMIEIPEYISITLPKKFKLVLREERRTYYKWRISQKVNPDDEMKIQWFPNTDRNYQIYSQIEKAQMEIIERFTLKQMLDTGKLDDDDIKDLPIKVIPVLMDVATNNDLISDMYCYNDNDIKENDEFVCKSTINESCPMGMNDINEDIDSIMMDKEIDCKDTMNFKIIDLNNVIDMIKKFKCELL